jgi:hypothetical protein
MRIFLLLFSILMTAQGALSQTAFFLKLGGGYAVQTYRDEAMSPLIYRGYMPGFQLGFDDYRPKGMHRLDMLGWVGAAKASSGRFTYNYNFAVNGGYMRRLGNSKWEPGLGGAFLIWSSLREHTSLVNSYVFYDIFIGLGPTASARRSFRLLRKDWIADAQLTVPLLVYGARPPYSGLDMIPFTEENFPDLRAYGLGSLDIFQHLKLRLELVKPLRRGNRISLAYHWEGYRVRLTPDRVGHSLQSLQFHLHVRL